MPALAQQKIREVALDRLPLLAESRPHGGDPRRVQRPECLSAPQLQRTFPQVGRALGTLGTVGAARVPVPGVRLSGQPAEFVHVDEPLVEFDEVAVRPPRDLDPAAGLGQRGAQQRHVRLCRAARPLGKPAASPHPLDEVVHRDTAVGVHDERGQDAALAGRPHVQQPVPDADLHRPQQPELHPCVVQQHAPSANVCPDMALRGY